MNVPHQLSQFFKRLFYVDITLRRALAQVDDAIVSGKEQKLLSQYLSTLGRLEHNVCFISEKAYNYVFVTVLFRLFNPILKVIERSQISYIAH